MGSAQRAVVERCIQRHRKHVVAVLLDAVDDPPEDESDCVDAILGDILYDNLRAFVRYVLAGNPNHREQFLAWFGDESGSIEAHSEEIEALFDSTPGTIPSSRHQLLALLRPIVS